MANRLAAGDQPLPPPAPRQPGRLVPLGRGGAGRARELDRPILLSVGYSACHWCHVMERESFEDAADRGLHERALRQRQGRPRGAPRRRRPLHGGGAGDQRPGRLADDRLPRPRGRALLRRHLLPARREPRDAELPDGDGSSDRGLRAASARRSASGPGRCASGSARSAEIEPAAGVPEAAPARGGGRRHCARSADTERGGFGAAPKFPPASALELLLARGGHAIVGAADASTR